MSGSTFETLMAPSLDLMSMKQLGNIKTRRVQVNPESGSSFALSGTSTQDVFFSLPSGGSKYEMVNGANSYLTFDILMTSASGTSTTLIGPCSGDFNAVVRGLETTVMGTTVEQIDRYNLLSSIFQDFIPAGKVNTMNSILSGGGSSKAGYTFAVASAYARPALPIYSAFYGVLASQFAPATQGTRMRFTLEAPNTALEVDGSGTPTLSYTITNLSLMMEYCSIEPSVWEAMAQQSGQVFKTHGIGVSNFNTTLTSATTANSVLIPARKSAVKHIWNCIRKSSNITAPLLNSIGSRYNPVLRQVYWTISGKQYPQIPIRITDATNTYYGSGEVMAEFLKTMRNLHANYTDCVFTRAQYINDITGTADTASFVCGFDWDTDADPMTISGIDTNDSNIYLQLDSISTGVPTASTVDSFVFYDAILLTNLSTGAVSVIQ